MNLLKKVVLIYVNLLKNKFNYKEKKRDQINFAKDRFNNH